MNDACKVIIDPAMLCDSQGPQLYDVARPRLAAAADGCSSFSQTGRGCGSLGGPAFRERLSLSRIRTLASRALGADVFFGCGTVYVHGTAVCAAHSDCEFVAERSR